MRSQGLAHKNVQGGPAEVPGYPVALTVENGLEHLGKLVLKDGTMLKHQEVLGIHLTGSLHWVDWTRKSCGGGVKILAEEVAAVASAAKSCRKVPDVMPD